MPLYLGIMCQLCWRFSEHQKPEKKCPTPMTGVDLLPKEGGKRRRGFVCKDCLPNWKGVPNAGT